MEVDVAQLALGPDTAGKTSVISLTPHEEGVRLTSLRTPHVLGKTDGHLPNWEIWLGRNGMLELARLLRVVGAEISDSGTVSCLDMADNVANELLLKRVSFHEMRICICLRSAMGPESELVMEAEEMRALVQELERMLASSN